MFIQLTKAHLGEDGETLVPGEKTLVNLDKVIAIADHVVKMSGGFTLRVMESYGELRAYLYAMTYKKEVR